MKKQDVVVGELYRISYRGKTTVARVTGERDGKPGWDGLDIATRRPVIVAAASRVQCRCDRNGKALEPAAKPAAAANRENARLAAERRKSTDRMTASERAMSAAAPAVVAELAKKARAKPGVAATVAAVEKGDLTKGVTVPTARRKRPTPRATPKVKAKGKGRSGLDAAVAVLAKADGPLGAQAIVDLALKRELWSTKGKTPAATIYAAMIREIASKGSACRFRKTGPNAFDLTDIGRAIAPPR
ncbi:MAG TPA: winged helix-turn-helix domain-containing protein [Phycisphaerae bacterium]|nr:winged helix-turn-helix domain-containing protein [Phycisphaerae bacterium]